MITFRVSTEVTDTRQVVLTLPPEVPIGKAELVVTIDHPASQPEKQPRTSLADRADENAAHWGTKLNSEYVEGFTGR